LVQEVVFLVAVVVVVLVEAVVAEVDVVVVVVVRLYCTGLLLIPKYECEYLYTPTRKRTMMKRNSNYLKTLLSSL
jgi:hypothetical protein